MNGVNETELSEKEALLNSGSSERAAQNKTIQEKLRECQEKVLTFGEKYDDDSLGYCPPTWDGVLCWGRSKSRQLISLPCPEYIVGFNHNENATKYCTEFGDWFTHPHTNTSWTNYTLCVPSKADGGDKLIAEWLPIIKKISQVGYALSLTTLLIAFVILVSIKKLRCPRNTLHMHLFVSFMLRAFMALLKDSIFIDGVGLPQSIVDGIFIHENPNWECKLVTSLWQFFIVANYTWILMEGLYLHNLIFLAPFSDSSAITLYVILGWGCPIPVVGSWVASRIILDDSLCWTTHNNNTDLFLIIRIPIVFTIVLNFVFFVNITRVLLIKLQSAVSIESRKYRYRKWAKSTLVLVPLFGAHYMIFIGMSYYMGRNPLIEVIWLFCDQLFASFQGFFVAILYCFMMLEVRLELGRKWTSWRTETQSKNLWIPLSKFYQQRSTNDENGLSGATSMAVHHSTVTQPLTGTSNSRRRTTDIEATEEHDIEI